MWCKYMKHRSPTRMFYKKGRFSNLFYKRTKTLLAIIKITRSVNKRLRIKMNVTPFNTKPLIELKNSCNIILKVPSDEVLFRIKKNG